MSGTAFHAPGAPNPEHDNVLGAVLRQVRTRPNGPALRARVGGAWRPTSWAEWHAAAREIAAGLATHGLARGDRIAVLGRHSPTSFAVDLGITALGGVAIPLPPGVPPPEVGAILRDANVRALFVDPDFAGRLVGIDHRAPLVCELPALEGEAGGDPTSILRARGRDALADDPDLARRIDAIPEQLGAADPWTILYTSGTTGVPRGIVLSHGAAIYQGGALARAGRLGPDDEQLLVLPVAQVFGRMTLQAGIAVGMPTALGSTLTLDRDLVEIAPACFAAVPELLERLAVRWRDGLDAGGWARPALEHALDVGKRVSALQQRKAPIPAVLGMQHKLAERMVLSRMRARLGNRLRFVACGGAALRRELAEFFHAFGVLVLDGYGLTEAGGVVTWNRPDEFRFGTVGRPLPGCDVHIAPDGELWVKSPSVGRALAPRPRADPESPETSDEQPTVDDGGFLHTGDIVEASAPAGDGRGWIRLVGRKRDIIKTASGKMIAPQKIESRLRAHEGIAHAVVLGEGRASLVALVDIDDDAMMELARREGLGCRSRTDLVEHPRIRALVAEAVAAVNTGAAKHELLAGFALLPEPLRASAGELTAAGVPRRQIIAARHGAQIAEAAGQRPGA